jgi:phospholipase A1
MERSWNRVYVEAIASNHNLMLSVKPWYVFHDSTYNKFNPNMSSYLGYGEIALAYKFASQVFSLQTHSLFEQGGRRATGIATYSFPLTRYLNGYIQAFSGYGQSLIEYNHRTNSVGVGIALNNLI